MKKINLVKIGFTGNRIGLTEEQKNNYNYLSTK